MEIGLWFRVWERVGRVWEGVGGCGSREGVGGCGRAWAGARGCGGVGGGGGGDMKRRDEEMTDLAWWFEDHLSENVSASAAAVACLACGE